MRWMILAAALLAPLAARAGEPQSTPLETALQEQLGQRTVDAVNWQARAIAWERKAAELQKQLDDMKNPAASGP